MMTTDNGTDQTKVVEYHFVVIEYESTDGPPYFVAVPRENVSANKKWMAMDPSGLGDTPHEAIRALCAEVEAQS